MLIEIIEFIIVAGGIAALAQGKGATPVLMGAIAVAGWTLIEVCGLYFVRAQGDHVFVHVAAWAWITVFAGLVRLVVRRWPS